VEGRPYWAVSLPGCPLCRVALDAERRYLRWFLLENYYTRPTLERLETDRFCRRHAGALLRGESRHLAGTFQFLAQAERQRLAQWRRELGSEAPPAAPAGGTGAAEPAREAASASRLHGLVRRLVPGSARDGRRVPRVRRADQDPGCPACEAGRGYQGSDGLCRPHLWEALRLAPTGTAVRLAADAEGRLEWMLREIDLYFHRLDYRYQDEPKGEEQGVWRRGVAFFWMWPEDASLVRPEGAAGPEGEAGRAPVPLDRDGRPVRGGPVSPAAPQGALTEPGGGPRSHGQAL
jgi:hypothetical protein